ncbi:MAG: hypothetical protein R3E61_06945 [Pseudomonadales bacterium]
MKKTLLVAALLAAGVTQVQAAPYNVDFFDGSPESSAVTITFSGFCSGQITDTVDHVWANASDDSMNNYSAVEARASSLSMDLSNSFYGESVGSSTSISTKKGTLAIALKDSSHYGLSERLDRVHSSGQSSNVTCKNGQTLQALLNDIGWDSYFVWDKTLSNNASFALKGKAEPFDYKYAQTVSGYLDLPAVCKNTGTFTGTSNIATDEFQSTCKMVNKVKVKMAINASGEIYYD